MANIQELLADSLEVLRQLQDKEPNLILRGTEVISRTHLNRLLANGWLQEVMKGWYIPSRPGSEGDTTVWYTSYWHFVRAYADSRFGSDWSLSADSSLDFHSGKTTVPGQLILKSPKASNNIVSLPYGHSLLPLKSELPQNIVVDSIYALRLYSLESALVYASPSYYSNDPVSARICLSMIDSASELLKILTDNGATTRAGRIIGALRSVGKGAIADEILSTMRDFGYTVTEDNPFSAETGTTAIYAKSPYVARMRMMWATMRKQVLDNFPQTPEAVVDMESYLGHVDEKYLEDAYHSLSIEGYQVSRELIEKVRSGNWKPDGDDKEQKSALVARGYYQAFQSVKESVRKILAGENAGSVLEEDYSRWYRQMWMPFVTAGILTASDLIGYRTNQVYIRGSQHIPLNPRAVSDAMPELFRLITDEPDPRVRAVLGHFMFVFIHPYMDGNGRMGRFILNAMLASGGYQWTVVPLEKRREYMSALEKASVRGDITDFTKLIAGLVAKT